MKQKHFNIPIFIPELACPFQCIFCDQSRITGVNKLPEGEQITRQIEDYLQTIPEGSEVQLAYFGGNFTGIAPETQEDFLKLADPYIRSGRIQGIRLSTRPDYINDEILTLLKRYQVQSIELGAQSFDNHVLKRSKRGHTAEQTEEASRKIKEYGFSLGLQMMIGLPGDSLRSSMHTAERIAAIGADDTRIYPALVIKGTVMEKMYTSNEFKPLSIKEAVSWCTNILPVFEKHNVRVLRVGLHPSDGLISGDDLVAGPFHPSFRELVESRRWKEDLLPLCKGKGKYIELKVSPGQLNYAVGYAGTNRKMLEEHYGQVKFRTSPDMAGREFTSSISSKA